MSQQTSPETDSATDMALQRRGRIIALAIFAVVALPLLAAVFIYYSGIGMPQGTANEGKLIAPPQAIGALSLQEWDQGEVWDRAAEDKRWRYVIPGFEGCDSQCRDNLYLTRQVHVRLANDAYRVERLLLLREGETLDSALQAFLEEEHPGLRVMRVSGDNLRTLLAGTNIADSDPLADGHYYLMDQQGFLMMAYGPDHSGNQLLSDIEHMLKVTYED